MNDPIYTHCTLIVEHPAECAVLFERLVFQYMMSQNTDHETAVRFTADLGENSAELGLRPGEGVLVLRHTTEHGWQWVESTVPEPEPEYAGYDCDDVKDHGGCYSRWNA